MTSTVNEEVATIDEDKIETFPGKNSGDRSSVQVDFSKDPVVPENEFEDGSLQRARNYLLPESDGTHDAITESQVSYKSDGAESVADDATTALAMPATFDVRADIEHQPGHQDASSSLSIPVVSVMVEADDVDTLDEYIRSPHGHNAIAERSPGGRYVRFIEKLGSGASKDVYRAYDTQEGIEVAWNVVNLSGVPKTERNRIVNEVRLLERLHHQNIISFHGSWVNRERQEVNFVTEILSSGTLKSFINKVQVIRWKIAKRWAVQILKGLEYLHSQDPPVIHRDLKCENIFINGTSGDLRIGDLGLSTVHRNGKVLSVLGTPEFMAPDMYEENSYDEKVDIYAFGMCLLEIFTKEIPYKECSNPAQIYKKVSRGDPPESLSRIKSRHAREFIEMCLGYKDENGNYIRPAAGELLTHDFLLKRPNDDDEVEVDRPLQQRTIREISTDSSQALPGSIAAASPVSEKVVNLGSEGNSPSIEEDESDGFSQMPDSEVNIRKVKVMMGRGQELKEEEASSAHGTMPSAVLLDIQGDSDQRVEALPVNGSVHAENVLEGEQPSFPHYLVAAAVIENEPTNSCPHADDVLKLVVTLPVEGQTQNVQFDFHLVEDDPVKVAKEMVAELCIPQEAVLEISETISGLACAARMKQDKYFGQVQGAKLRMTSQTRTLISQSGHSVTNAPSSGQAAKVDTAQGNVATCQASDAQSLGKSLVQSACEYVAGHTVVQSQSQLSIQKQHDQSSSSQGQQQQQQYAKVAPIHQREFQKREACEALGQTSSSSHSISQLTTKAQTTTQSTDSPGRHQFSKFSAQRVEPQSNGDFQGGLAGQDTLGPPMPPGYSAQCNMPNQSQNIRPPNQGNYHNSLGPPEAHSPTGVQFGRASTRQVSHVQHTSNAEHQSHKAASEPKSQTPGSYSQAPSSHGSQQVQASGQQGLSDSISQSQVYAPIPSQCFGSLAAHPTGEFSSQQSETHQPAVLYSNQPQGQDQTRQHPLPLHLRSAGTLQQSVQLLPSSQTSSTSVPSISIQLNKPHGLRPSGPSQHIQSQQSSSSMPMNNSGRQHFQSGGAPSSVSPRDDGVSLPSPHGHEANLVAPFTSQWATSATASCGGNQDLPIGTFLEVQSIDADDLGDDAIMLAELKKLDEDFKKNMMISKKVFDTRMDNLQRTQHQREALHLRTLEKHQKERAEFEKRMQQEEIEQNRRIEQLQREWDRRREAVRQKQVADNAGDTHPLESSVPEKF